MKDINRLDAFEELITSVVNTIDPKWSDIEKMRAVYIGICKGVTKNVDFFYALSSPDPSTDNYEYIRRHYNMEMSANTNMVICKTVVVIIKDALKRLGIKSKLVQSVEADVYDDGENQIAIYHWFLSAKDKQGNNYFMVPMSDLANVKLGYKTNHFATSVTYRTDDGKKFYKGERLNCTILSDKKLYEIDKKIGYVEPTYENINGELVVNGYTNYHMDEFDILKKYVRTNGYTKLLCEETEFFKNAFTFKYHDFICYFREIPDIIKDEKVINAWLLCLEEYLKSLIKDFDIVKQKQALGQLETIKKAAFKENGLYTINRVIYKLSEMFINDEYKMVGKEVYSTEYIIHKFNLFFPYIMSVDNDLVTKRLNGISEQVAITEKIIKIIFSELTNNNCLPTTQINKDVGVIMSRIERFNIKNKKTGEYAMLFIIDKLDDPFFFFNPNTGDFKKSNDLLKILSEYRWFSNRLNCRMFQIEREANKKCR